MEKKSLQPLGRGGKIALIALGSLSALSACLWLGVSVASHGEGGYVLLFALSLLVSAILWGVFLFRRKERSLDTLALGGRALAITALVLSVVGSVGLIVALNLRGAIATAFSCVSILAILAGVIMGIVAACMSNGNRGTLVLSLIAALFPVVAFLAVIGLLLVGVPVIRFM